MINETPAYYFIRIGWRLTVNSSITILIAKSLVAYYGRVFPIFVR